MKPYLPLIEKSLKKKLSPEEQFELLPRKLATEELV
jgi:hypothetical protein